MAIRFAWVTVVCVALSGAAVAKDVLYYSAHGGPAVRSDSQNPGSFAAQSAPTKSVKAGNTTFNITYFDSALLTGKGFDDPVQGATRRATAEAVLAYIATVFNEPANATLDVTFEQSSVAGAGPLADAGTFYFSSTGFSNGVASQHIISGIDPLGPFADIVCTVDFGYIWNSDHTLNPSFAEFDLFTVLLHEMTHAFGVVSLSNASGQSTVTSTNPGKYSVWDRNMRFATSIPVWNGSTTALQVSSAAFTSNNLSLAGTEVIAEYGSQPPVFAPSPFQTGFSLSHFEEPAVDSVNNQSFFTGVTAREYSPVDRATLLDIGYLNIAGPPSPAVVINQSGGGFVEEGDPVTLLIEFSGIQGDATGNWLRNNIVVIPDGNLQVSFNTATLNVAGNTVGLFTASLTISSAELGHTGSYTVVGNDQSKGLFQGGFRPLTVAPFGNLPAAGATGLGILAGALVIGSIVALRRRNRN